MDQPFDFSLGSEGGKSDTRAIEFGVELSESQRESSSIIYTSIKFGVDAFGASAAESSNIPDGEFALLLFRASYSKRIDLFNRAEFTASITAQKSFDPLLNIEKMALGGRSSVRGYRESKLVRDNGAYANLEFKIPIYRGWRKEKTNNEVNLKIFSDVGLAWNDDSSTVFSEKQQLAGLGIGLNWKFFDRWYVDFEFAEPLVLEEGLSEKKSLQGEGFYFNTGYSYVF